MGLSGQKRYEEFTLFSTKSMFSLDVRAEIDADEDYPKHEWVDIDPSDEKVRDVRESSTDIKMRMTGDYRYRVLEINGLIGR